MCHPLLINSCVGFLAQFRSGKSFVSVFNLVKKSWMQFCFKKIVYLSIFPVGRWLVDSTVLLSFDSQAEYCSKSLVPVDYRPAEHLLLDRTEISERIIFR